MGIRDASGYDWDGLAEQLAASSVRDFIFPKVGKTRIRLLWRDTDPEPFRKVETTFRGRLKEKYMLLAFAPESPEEIKAVVLPKSAFRSVTDMLAEGYELFGLNGHGITVIRTGSGLDTTYNVIASRSPIPVPQPILTLLQASDVSLQKMVDLYQEFQARRTGGGAQQATAATASTSPTASAVPTTTTPPQTATPPAPAPPDDW